MIQLLSNTRMTETLPTSGGDFGPAYWVAGINSETGSHILKTAVYNSTSDVPISVSFEGCAAGATANLTVLTAPDGYSYNDIGSDVVEKSTTTITASAAGVFSFSLPNLSVSVLEVTGEANVTHPGWGKEPKRVIPRGYREVVF